MDRSGPKSFPKTTKTPAKNAPAARELVKRKTKKSSFRFTTPKKRTTAPAPPKKPKTVEPARTPVRDNADATNDSFDFGESAANHPQLFSQLSHESSSQFQDVDLDKLPPDAALTAQQQKEQRMKFQRLRALKAAGKYNSKLNHQRFTQRRFYFDLQTNIIHVPRRQVQVIALDPELANLQAKEQSKDPSVFSGPQRSTGAYPASLMAYPPQYSDYVPVFSSQELGYFPLNTVVHHAAPYATQSLGLTAEESRLKRLQNGEADSGDESPALSEDEPERIQPFDIGSEAYDTEEQSLSNFPDPLEIPPVHTPLSTRPARIRSRTPSFRARNSRPVSAHQAAGIQIPTDAAGSEPVMDLGPVPADTCYYCFLRENAPLPPKLPEVQKPIEESVLDPTQTKKKPRRQPMELDYQAVMKENFVSCTKCDKKYHPSCAGLARPTLLGMKKFPWECSECKKCIKCNSSAQEGKMMFCDLCDRGFHSFCVHVPKIPRDRWLCEQCAVCSLCGATRPNEEGKRGRACIWQLDWDEDAGGNVIAVRTLCYPCFKKTKKRKVGSFLGDEEEESAHHDDEE